MENFVRSAMNAVKLHKSGGESGGKKLYRLVAVKLHNFTALKRVQIM